ncbi:MAG: hypothetical protein ACI92E_002237 [Oceanicoccus sp.]|jgi:hypothetical protein
MNEGQEPWQQVASRFAEERRSSADAVFLKRSLADVDEGADDIIHGLHIQTGLDAVALVKAPRSLHQKLVSIPNNKIRALLFGWPAPLAAAAAVLVVIFVGNYSSSQQLSEKEIAQARQDLATTFRYLHLANNRTRNHVEKIISENVNESLKVGFFGKSGDKS